MHPDTDQPAHRDPSAAPLRLHGVLVRVFGAGILLIGDSGIGKSECALDLITRGHRLVADDAVDVTVAENALIGSAPASTFSLIEIRGLGVINVKRTFGEDAACESCAIEMCIELHRDVDGERLGNFVREHLIAGRAIPKFVLPVTPGRNLAILVETAARIYLNRDKGAAAGDDLLGGYHELPETATIA